ncbi:MAG: hypothetical protein J5926_01600 [Ruminococcus sp.]|nr:hypothetical protein [Ruminococcus sp.]
MEKRNMFDLLEDSDEGELAMIDRLTPEFSEEQFERILEMSKRKRNIIRASKERNNINKTTAGFAAAEVTGVEEYKRPTILKIAATVASLILLGGGLALGHNLLKRSNPVEPDIVPNVAAVTVTTTNSATTDGENAAVTTITADVTAEVSGTAVDTTAVSSAQATAAAPVSSQAQAQTQAAVTIADNTVEAPVVTENPAYRAEAETWVKKYLDTSYLSYVNFDYLDLNDTFDAMCELYYLDIGTTEEDRPREMHTKTFVHYVNPEFPTIDSMKQAQIDFIYPFYQETPTQNSMDEMRIKRFCGMKVTPGEVIEDNYYNKYDTYPTFTEYDGKIYMCVYDNGELDKYKPSYQEIRYQTNEKWYVRNCTENSFEYVTLSDNEYLGNIEYVEKVDGKFRGTNNIVISESGEDIQTIYEEYEKYRCE